MRNRILTNTPESDRDFDVFTGRQFDSDADVAEIHHDVEVRKKTWRLACYLSLSFVAAAVLAFLIAIRVAV